jgi:hypothetical protein
MKSLDDNEIKFLFDFRYRILQALENKLKTSTHHDNLFNLFLDKLYASDQTRRENMKRQDLITCLQDVGMETEMLFRYDSPHCVVLDILEGLGSKSTDEQDVNIDTRDVLALVFDTKLNL